MVRPLRSRALLALVASAALAAPAAAGPAGWQIEGRHLRYELQAPEPPQGIPAPRAFRLLGPSTFPDGATPGFHVADLGDVVWRYALALPRGAGEQVDESFPVPGGALRVQGQRAAKKKGKALTVRAALRVTSTGNTPDDPLKAGATLELVSAFDLGQGLLREASFSLSGAGGLAWSGSIAPGAVVETEAAEFHTQVAQAIDRARGWLAKTTHQRLNAYKGQQGPQLLGHMALLCFALLRSGTPPEELETHFAWMERQPHERTYSVALWILALEALSVQRSVRPAQEGTRSVARFRRGQVAARHKALMARATEWLVDACKSGWWDYGADKKRGDRSNSQFAVLALHSASAAGVAVPAEVWQQVLQEAIAHQEKGGAPVDLDATLFGKSSPFARVLPGQPASAAAGDDTRVRRGGAGSRSGERPQGRGWAYGQAGPAGAGQAYGSMTSAGVSTLAVVLEALREGGATGEGARGAHRALIDGLAWLCANFDPASNPGRGSAHYFYFLYSFEKAMDCVGIERLGRHEWYREIAAELLARQAGTGAWGTAEDTALALLVLNRATLSAGLEIQELGRVLTGVEAAWDTVALEGVGRLSARQVLEALAETPEDAAGHLPLAKQALEAMLPEARARLAPTLAPLLESPVKAVRRWAEKACKELCDSKDPAAVLAFGQTVERLVAIDEARDPASIPEVRELLRGVEAPALQARAVETLGRLGAVEALPDLLDALEATRDDDARELLFGHVVSLAGGRPRDYDPRGRKGERERALAEWRAWWRAEGGELVARQELRRALAGLGNAARFPAAATAIRAAGERALPGLVDALYDEAIRERAYALLCELTGASLPASDADAWRRWLAEPGEKLASRRGGPIEVPRAEPAAPKPAPAAPKPAPAAPTPAPQPPARAEPAAPAEPSAPEPAPAEDDGWELVPRPSQR